MAPHNSERQTVLKRKREEAEEEARAQFTKAQSEKDARAAKKSRVKAPKKQKPAKKPQTGRKGGRAGIKPREKTPGRTAVSIPDEVAGPETKDNPPLEARSENTGDAAGTTVKNQVEDQSQEVPEPLLATADTESHVRRLISDRVEWIQIAKNAESGPDGIEELGPEIDSQEAEGYDTTFPRRQRHSKRKHVGQAKEATERLGEQIQGLYAMQATYNSVLYDLTNFSRESVHLDFLTDDYWQLLSQCRAAKSACKDLELDSLEADQAEKERGIEFMQAAKQAHSVSAGAASPSSQAAVEDSQETLSERLDAHYASTIRKKELADSLQQARSELSKIELTLNSITYELLAEHNRLRGDSAVNNGEEEHHSRASPSPTHGDNHEEANVEEHPLAETTQDDQARVKKSMYERLRANENKEPLTRSALAAHTAKVKAARNDRELRRDIFASIRHTKSWDDIGAGPTQAEYLATKGREAIDAEKQYREDLHEAQRVGAMSYASSQTSYFRISPSEGAREKKRTNPSEGEDEFPLPEPKRAKIQDWAETATGDGQIAWLPDLRKDKEMDRNAILEAGYGEDPHYTGFGRAQQRLNREREFRENLRKELQGTKQQDGSSGVANKSLAVEPGEDDLHFDLAEDNHRLDNAEGALRPRSVRKIALPAPAENDHHPKNSSAKINPEISQVWGWADFGRPIMRRKDTPMDEKAQQVSEGVESDAGAEPEANGFNNDQYYPDSGSGQALLYDPSAPLIDYAIEGYDGENMDGIE